MTRPEHDGNEDDLVRRWCAENGIRPKPWEIAPWDVTDGPCPFSPGTGGALSWPSALELRRRALAEMRQKACDGP